MSGGLIFSSISGLTANEAMATTTVLSAREQRLSAVVAGRVDGLRRAKRHSRFVRLMRKMLPAACGLMLTGYVLSVLSRSGVDTGLPALDIGRLAATDLKMQNPKYDGFGKDGSSYTFAAKTAQQDLLKPGIVTLDGITGHLIQADKSKTNVTASAGVYDSKESVLDLSGGIKVASENGMSVDLPRAQLKNKEGLLTSADPVVVAFPAGTINATGLTLRQKVKEITFNSNVVAHLKAAEPKAKESNDAVAAEPAAPAGGMFGQSKQPLDVTSQRLDVNDIKKTATFSGNVRAVQGDSVMETPELIVGYGGQDPNAEAQPAAAGGMLAGAAGKVKDIIASGPVVMTRGAADRITSERAQFDAQNETGILSGNVVLTSGADRRATGDRVDLDQKNQRAVLSGREVIVTQGANEMRGQRLFLDQQASRTQLTSPQSGRIAATFVQDAKKKPAPSSGDGQANDNKPAMPFAAQFKTDPNAPIKLQANQLDVDDKAKTAIFSGDVIAEQAGFVMRTPEMHAIYTGAAGIADVATTSSPTGAKAPAAQISRIQARKKVQVTTSDGNKVDGDWADVDMKANKVTVGGDVKLTQGRSVVNGTRLIIDMTTGKSTLDTQSVAGNPASDGWQANNGVTVNGGRPSAVFYPQELKANKDKKKQ